MLFRSIYTLSLAAARDHLGLGPASTVLAINTEGATDPEHYRRIIAGEEAP